MASEYGRTVSAADAALADSPIKDEQPKNVIDGSANLLWMYQNTGTINGTPIDSSALGLPIDRPDLLEAALYLNRKPKSAIFWMSPEDTDSIEKYDQLLEDQFNGKVLIVEELKQYDQSKSKFMVWVRYDELCYMLHPRFAYLREENS